LSIAHDISGRKRMEEALRDSEEKYQTIFAATETATAIFEEDTILSLVNDEFEKLSGYSKEEIEGKKSWSEFVAKDDLERMKEYHYRGENNPDTTPRNYELRFINRQGKVKDIFMTIAMFPGTKKSVASLIDITGRKQAEEALKAGEKRFRLLAENARDLIYRLRLLPELKFEYISPSSTHILGLYARKFLRRPVPGFSCSLPG